MMLKNKSSILSFVNEARQPKLSSYGLPRRQKWLLAKAKVCSLLILMCLCLTACGKRSTPEPAYASPPFMTENPTPLD